MVINGRSHDSTHPERARLFEVTTVSLDELARKLHSSTWNRMSFRSRSYAQYVTGAARLVQIKLMKSE